MKPLQSMANNALKNTQTIIDEFGPRLAGTSACLNAADAIASKMEAVTDKVEKEHFFLYQGAFLGWIRILVVLYLAGGVLLWLNQPLVTVILLVLGLLILVLQFFLYKPLLDRFYPKKTGCNVIGTIEPEQDVKRQIIVSGHHDSARIFNFFIHQPKLYNLRVTGGIGLIVLMLLVGVFNVIVDLPTVELVLTIIVTAGFLLTGQMWFFASKNGTPGAGDNLIASTMTLELGQYFKNNPLQHTRIIMASFDAEEEGLRGARAYAKTHKQEFQELDTTLLNVDCPYYLKDVFFLTSDINGSVELSTELAKDLVTIATQKGYPAKHQPIAFLTGGTDAAELAKVGVKATTLMAMPWNNNERASVYHTPHDTVDAIEIEAVQATLDIFTEYIQQQDQK
ncbi:M28 family metallopeptidase [Candidatus Xianfuyuplasma coldseepsis]|uniref:Zn-dependent exopeptidase M28 n=1 Tax=Candidatus Xianfuyuplasma coldseepsis TaxID=2782163 RepID=A0A7L7KRL4_9MOLU|nr:M28 family peptidase [Xianfuyuplasma coldseepsis]QMS85225.1 Zn-dependent exopeptidase M28 [Xianfuyuplasma coldseepsis]